MLLIASDWSPNVVSLTPVPCEVVLVRNTPSTVSPVHVVPGRPQVPTVIVCPRHTGRGQYTARRNATKPPADVVGDEPWPRIRPSIVALGTKVESMSVALVKAIVCTALQPGGKGGKGGAGGLGDGGGGGCTTVK